MEKNLEKFNKNLIIADKGKKIVYSDEKGNHFIVALSVEYQHMAQLFINCEYVEADEKELKSLLFNGQIEKDMKFNKIKIQRPISKYELTKKESDKNLIVDHDVEVYQIWIVRNGFKLSKSFNNKDDAIDFCTDENKKLFDLIEK